MSIYSLHGRFPLGKRNAWPHTTLQMVEEMVQWEAPKQGNGGASSLNKSCPPKSPLFLNLGHVLAPLRFDRFTLVMGALYKEAPTHL